MRWAELEGIIDPGCPSSDGIHVEQVVSMNLDIRTIIFLTAFGSFAMGLALLVATRAYPSRFRGMNLWAIASLAQSVALTLLWLRDRIPDAFSIVGGNTLVILSLVVSYQAVMQFKGRRFPKLPLYSLVVFAFLASIYFAYVVPNTTARAILSSVNITIPLSLAAGTLLLDKRPKPFSHWMTGIVFLSSALVTVARLVHLIFFGGTLATLFAQNPMQHVFFAYQFVTVTLLTFGFMLMCNDRFNTELTEALRRVKTLSGLLPICSSCKSVRDDHGYWQQIEGYVEQHSDAEFSHSICPSCARALYPSLSESTELS